MIRRLFMEFWYWLRAARLARKCQGVGSGTRFLGPNIEIKGRVTLGAKCAIGGNVVMRTHKRGNVVLGDEVILADYVLIQVNDEVSIGDGSYLGPYVVVRDSNHRVIGTEYHWRYTPLDTRPIRIGRDCYIGASTYILPGVEIGDGAVVAPGSILNKHVGAMEVWAGSPAIRVAHRTDPELTTKLSRYREFATMFGLGHEPPAEAGAPAETL